MSLDHSWYKIKPYISPTSEYWKKCDHINYAVESKLGPFFGMRLKDRLFDGHYNTFDQEGLPTRYRNGKIYYNYSTIFSYALAHYEMFLETGDEEHLIPMENAVTFMKKSGERTAYGGLVFPQNEVLSAMNQGEALSILSRLFEINKEESILELMKSIILPYNIKVQDRGVKGKFTIQPEVFWYEEISELPGKHILNGMNYALLGLYDLEKSIPGFADADKLFKNGIDFLKSALHLFDNGYWSLYWIDDNPPHYIASAMYHNLHIRQLEYFGNELGEEVLSNYAIKFDNYRQQFINRLKAAQCLLGSKLHL